MPKAPTAPPPAKPGKAAKTAAAAPEGAKPAEAAGDPPEGSGTSKTGKIERAADVEIGDLGDMASMEDGDEYVNMIWWGREGSWKTSELMTAANRGRLLVVNAEGGFKKKPLRELGVDLDNVVLWPDPRTGVEIAVETLQALYWRIKAKLMAEPGYFYAVGWDSVSDIYTRFVSEVRRKEYEKNAALPLAKRKDFRSDPYFTDRADYGVATEQLRELLRQFRDLPCHFLVTALERRDIDPDTSTVAYGPGVGPAFQKDLLGYLDITVATKAVQYQTGPDPEIDLVDQGIGLTRANARNRAKDRFKSLPRRMANPTFERVLDYIEDKVTEEDDPVQREWAELRALDLTWTGGTTPEKERVDEGGEDAGIETTPVDD